jgi:hypothetical protein
MKKGYVQVWSSTLRQRGIPLQPGLSDEEVSIIEEKYGFRFSPDLRTLLQHSLPAGEGFPNWRNGPEAELRKRLSWPLDGLLFDVEHNAVWLRSWGLKPPTPEEAFEQIRHRVGDAPTLVPVYGHRYIPTRPHLSGNPVLSVWQTDIICYGNDLADYFRNEFQVLQPEQTTNVPRPVEFWTEIMDWNNQQPS